MEIYILLAILAAGALIRLPLIKFPIDDDLGYFSYAPWFRKRGVRLGRDIYTRLPMHWLYTLAFALFGRKPHSPKIFDVLYELLTAAAIYGLCVVTLTPAVGPTPTVGLVAAAFYLWFSNSASVGLFSGCNERYYSVFVAAGFLFLLMGLDIPSGEADAYFFVSGLFFAAGFYFKDVLVVNVAAAAATVLFIQTTQLDPLLWLGAGFLLVAVVIYIPLIHLNGGLPAFINLSWEGYKRALQDNPDRGSTKKLLVNGGRFFMETAPLAVIPILYAFTFGVAWDGATDIVFAAWLVSTAAVFFIQGVYWPYHFISFIPPLSVISAAAVIRFAAEQSGLPFETRLLWWIALAASFAVSGFLQVKALVNGGDPEKQGGSYTWGKLEQLIAAPKIAEYIRARTSKGDYIYQWGCFYHLYLLTDRLCPVFGCLSLAPPVKEWKINSLKNIVNGLKKNPPRFIVIHLQRIDMSVLEELTGLRYELEKVFSKGLRVYGLVETGGRPARDVSAAALEELLADADVPFKLGMELLDKGDKIGAGKKFDEAVSLNPAHIGVLFARAKTAWEESRYAEAEKIYGRLKEWDDREYRTAAIHELLRLYNDSGSRDGVENVIRSLEKRDEKAEPPIAYHLAAFFIKRNMSDRALEIYKNSKPLTPSQSTRRFYVSREYHTGKIYFEKGDYQKAIDHLELCLKTEPAHNKAEALLADAISRLKPVAVNSVAMFACAPPDEIDHALSAAHRDFPGCKIVFVALRKTDSRYASDKRIDSTVTLPFDNFSIGGLLLPSTRRLLSSIAPDIAAIPTPLPNLAHNAVVYLNMLLYASAASPKRSYFYKGPYFNRREASVGTFARVIVKKVYETLMMPAWMAVDLYQLWRHPQSGELLGFSPEPNDLVAHNVKAAWMKQNGIKGVSFSSYMGNPYSLYYPPLAIWLLDRIGTIGFMTAQTLFFAISAVAAAVVTGHAWLILFVPHLVSSLLYRVNTIYAGRLDFLPWGFVLGSLASLYSGHPLIAALLYSGAVMSHTTVSILGGMGLLTLAATTGRLFPDFLVMVPLTMAITFSWWLPFLKNRSKFAFHRVWSEIGFCKDNYKTYWAPFRNLTLFLTAALFAGEAVPEQAVILIPWFIYLVGLSSKRYVFQIASISGAVLTLGGFALFLNPAPLTAALFFILINATDALDSPRIIPLFEEPFLASAKKLLGRTAKNNRLALECRPESYWDDNMCWGWLFNLAANRFGFQMLAGVGFDQVDPALPLECETKMNSDTSPAKLEEILRKTACSLVASYSPQFGAMLETMGFAKLDELNFPPLGFLKERRWTLYRADFEPELVEPPARWSYLVNGFSFRPNGKSVYRIKLAYYRGWEAVQNARKLPVRDLSPGMEVTVDGEGEVLMRYRPRLSMAWTGNYGKAAIKR